jgi:hypothetical protein
MATWTSGIDTFKAALKYGGARPAFFDFNISGTTTVGSINLYCNVSALPPLTVTPIERQYFGRTVKIPGDMVFGDLSTTIIQTEAGEERADIEAWMAKINSHVENVRDSSFGPEMGSDWSTGLLTQYNKAGDEILEVTFTGLWPTTIAEIPLSYDTMSDIEQFDVTWAYQHYNIQGYEKVTEFPAQ